MIVKDGQLFPVDDIAGKSAATAAEEARYAWAKELIRKARERRGLPPQSTVPWW